MKYLVIAITISGPKVEWLDKETLEQWLNFKRWGDIKWLAPPGDNSSGILNIIKDVGCGIIIKGEIVKPKETKYEVD